MDWTPPKFLFEAQHRRREKLYMAPSNWDTSFRTFRSYSDTVLEYLRRKGYNATFIIRICTGLPPPDRAFFIEYNHTFSIFKIETVKRTHRETYLKIGKKN